MKSIFKKYKYLIIFIIFLLLVYIAVPSINYTNCRIDQRFREISFDGVVVNKYLDKTQHSQPKVEILDLENNLIRIYLYNEATGIYDKIRTNDTLRKKSGSNEIQVKTGGEYNRFGVADFNCDSAQLQNEKYLGWLYKLVGTIHEDKTLREKSESPN